MRTSYNVCSKLWYDINIDFVRKNIRHCCKATRDHETTQEEIDRLGKDVFNHSVVTQHARRTMLVRNKLPHVCTDCIKHEPNSIRHVWNVWSDADIDTKRKHLQTDDHHTNYIEFDLGPQCDLACVYCGPWSSTTWAKELGWENKTKIDPVWKESVLENLTKYIVTLPKSSTIAFNILGGEPTLMKETYEIIERLKTVCDHFDHKPVMMITTNLNTKTALMTRFLKILEETKDIFKWSVAVSIEDIGERAEAIRYNLDWKRFSENLVKINELADLVYLTTTFNSMNFPYFGEFIDWSFATMGEGYGSRWMYSTNSVQDGYSDIAYLRPDQIDVTGIKQALKKHATVSNNTTQKMFDHLDNLESRLGTKAIDDKFVEHWEQLVARRGLDYLNLFPVIKDVIDEYKNAH